MFLKVSRNSQDSNCARVYLWKKLKAEDCDFIKKETLAQVLSCELCVIFKNTCFRRTLAVAGSVAPLVVVLACPFSCPFDSLYVCLLASLSVCLSFCLFIFVVFICPLVLPVVQSVGFFITDHKNVYKTLTKPYAK